MDQLLAAKEGQIVYTVADQPSESAGNAGQNAQRMAAPQSERLLDISERRRTAGDTQEKLVLVWGSAGVA